jgi:propanediol dehydratase small subunit
MLKNKEHVDSEFVKEKKIKSKFTDDWKRDKELNEVEKERIGLVYEFLRSMKTTEKEILGFRKNMCLPFKLDYLIGYQIGRVS